MDGENIALKARSEKLAHEDGAKLIGTIINHKVELTLIKGEIGGDAKIVMDRTEKGYPIIFYETKFPE